MPNAFPRIKKKTYIKLYFIFNEHLCINCCSTHHPPVSRNSSAKGDHKISEPEGTQEKLWSNSQEEDGSLTLVPKSHSHWQHQECSGSLWVSSVPPGCLLHIRFCWSAGLVMVGWDGEGELTGGVMKGSCCPWWDGTFERSPSIKCRICFSPQSGF